RARSGRARATSPSSPPTSSRSGSATGCRTTTTSSRAGPALLLAVDVGNTQTVFGLFDGDRLSEQFRTATDPARTADELAVTLRALVDLESLDGIVVCSSVPQLVRD